MSTSLQIGKNDINPPRNIKRKNFPNNLRPIFGWSDFTKQNMTNCLVLKASSDFKPVKLWKKTFYMGYSFMFSYRDYWLGKGRVTP